MRTYRISWSGLLEHNLPDSQRDVIKLRNENKISCKYSKKIRVTIERSITFDILRYVWELRCEFTSESESVRRETVYEKPIKRRKVWVLNRLVFTFKNHKSNKLLQFLFRHTLNLHNFYKYFTNFNKTNRFWGPVYYVNNFFLKDIIHLENVLEKWRALFDSFLFFFNYYSTKEIKFWKKSATKITALVYKI